MLTSAGVASRRQPRSIAGGLLVFAGVIYLLAECAAALAFSPSYSYATNYISDLGVAGCGEVFDGRPICSPLHLVMDAGFILAATSFSAAAIVCVAVLRGRWRFVFLALVCTHAVGNYLVALVPETAVAAPGALKLHLLGAALAIIGGNVAILSSAPLSKALELPAFDRLACVAFPLFGLTAFYVLFVARTHSGPNILPDGAWERMSVYTITGWQILIGLGLLATRPR